MYNTLLLTCLRRYEITSAWFDCAALWNKSRIATSVNYVSKKLLKSYNQIIVV